MISPSGSKRNPSIDKALSTTLFSSKRPNRSKIEATRKKTYDRCEKAHDKFNDYLEIIFPGNNRGLGAVSYHPVEYGSIQTVIKSSVNGWGELPHAKAVRLPVSTP